MVDIADSINVTNPFYALITEDLEMIFVKPAREAYRCCRFGTGLRTTYGATHPVFDVWCKLCGTALSFAVLESYWSLCSNFIPSLTTSEYTRLYGWMPDIEKLNVRVGQAKGWLEIDVLLEGAASTRL